MAQQTAVEWFLQELIRCGWLEEGQINITLEQANKIHKDQIETAWRNGDNDSMYSPKELDQQAEQYYNETYGKR